MKQESKLSCRGGFIFFEQALLVEWPLPEGAVLRQHGCEGKFFVLRKKRHWAFHKSVRLIWHEL
jgi:hypothetical protein